jgi:hypothetical protein
MKKEDQGTPKDQGPITSENLESTNREATNNLKNRKNDLQLNTPDPLPLKSLNVSTSLC